MNESILITASRLSDDALLARMKLHVGGEREAIVNLVADLAVLLGTTYLGDGWGSLFAYCRDHLHLSGDAAYNRLAAARAVRKFPVILDHLVAGFVTVTTVKVLRGVLTTQNHLAVLADAKYRSKMEVERIVARLDPKPDVPSTIRKLPPPTQAGPPVPAPVDPVTVAKQPKQEDAPVPRPRDVFPLPARRPVFAPLAPERYRVQFTIPEDTHDKLRHVQDLLCREIPDGGRCSFEGRKGRCAERRYLEWHHVQPHSHKGPATIENISLRCRAHNVYESELLFGRFDPSLVREAPENYATSREIAPFQNGGTSDTPAPLP